MWRLGEMAKALGLATTAPDLPIEKIVTDSRQVEAGSLYVARIGENSDGHQYLAAAKAAGAVAALVQNTAAAKKAGLPYLQVPNTTRALGWLAKAHLVALRRRNADLRVIGITGSVGKTTTKDLLYQLLQKQGPTVAPQLSFNNEVGLPLTVLAADLDTRYLVLEMGASGPGHLAYLTEIAPLDIAVELFVGGAHLDGFRSEEELAQTKAELLWGLRNCSAELKYGISEAAEQAVEEIRQDGFPYPRGELISTVAGRREKKPPRDWPATPRSWIVLNRANPWTGEMASGPQVLGYSADPELKADLTARQIVLNQYGQPHFQLGPHKVSSQLIGQHNVANILAALSVCAILRLPLAECIADLAQLKAISPHRLDLREIGQEMVLLDDSYNANLDSMRAGLKTLEQIAKNRKNGGRKVAILGEMLELGDFSVPHHRAVAAQCRASKIDLVISVGEAAKEICAALPPEIESYGLANVQQVAKVGLAKLQPKDTILIKGSNGSGVWQIADQLIKGEF